LPISKYLKSTIRKDLPKIGVWYYRVLGSSDMPNLLFQEGEAGDEVVGGGEERRSKGIKGTMKRRRGSARLGLWKRNTAGTKQERKPEEDRE